MPSWEVEAWDREPFGRAKRAGSEGPGSDMIRAGKDQARWEEVRATTGNRCVRKQGSQLGGLHDVKAAGQTPSMDLGQHLSRSTKSGGSGSGRHEKRKNRRSGRNRASVPVPRQIFRPRQKNSSVEKRSEERPGKHRGPRSLPGRDNLQSSLLRP